MYDDPQEILVPLLETILYSLIVDQDAIRINLIEGMEFICLEVEVSKEETCKVIGRGGRTATSIRTILRGAASKQRYGKDIQLRIKDWQEQKKRFRGSSWRSRDEYRNHD